MALGGSEPGKRVWLTMADGVETGAIRRSADELNALRESSGAWVMATSLVSTGLCDLHEQAWVSLFFSGDGCSVFELPQHDRWGDASGLIPAQQQIGQAIKIARAEARMLRMKFTTIRKILYQSMGCEGGVNALFPSCWAMIPVCGVIGPGLTLDRDGAGRSTLPLRGGAKGVGIRQLRFARGWRWLTLGDRTRVGGGCSHRVALGWFRAK